MVDRYFSFDWREIFHPKKCHHPRVNSHEWDCRLLLVVPDILYFINFYSLGILESHNQLPLHRHLHASHLVVKVV